MPTDRGNLRLSDCEEDAIRLPFCRNELEQEAAGEPCLHGGGKGEDRMVANPLLHQILSDELLTRGLGDAEARVLVEWLVEQAEELMELESGEKAQRSVGWLCRRGRALAHFVRLWCLDREWGAAGQFAAAERFAWSLPAAAADACELMLAVVSWEGDQFWQRRRMSPAA